MISYIEPPVVKSGLYPVGETAKLLGVHRHTLDTYEQKELIESERSAYNGRRVFRGREIIKCWKRVRRVMNKRNQV